MNAGIFGGVIATQEFAIGLSQLGTDGSNPSPSSGESTANLPRIYEGKVGVSDPATPDLCPKAGHPSRDRSRRAEIVANAPDSSAMLSKRCADIPVSHRSRSRAVSAIRPRPA